MERQQKKSFLGRLVDYLAGPQEQPRQTNWNTPDYIEIKAAGRSDMPRLSPKPVEKVVPRQVSRMNSPTNLRPTTKQRINTEILGMNTRSLPQNNVPRMTREELKKKFPDAVK